MKIPLEYKKTIKNAIYLVLVQGSNYIVPLVVMFVLLKTKGPSGFGVYAFWYSVVLYVQTVIDYGFSFTATRDIAASKERNDTLKIKEIFTIVTVAKSIISFFSFILIVLAVIVFKVEFKLFFFVVLSGVLMALTPNLYFQGIQDVKRISIVNVFSKVLYCFLVYFFINKTSDTSDLFLCYFLCSLLPFVYGYQYIFRKEIDFFCVINIIKNELFISNLIRQYRIGWDIFTTSALSIVISNAGVFWLGLTANPAVLGGYATTEKAIKAILGIFMPFFQAIYPLNSSKFSQSFSNGMKCAVSTGCCIILFCATFSVIFYIYSPVLMSLLNLDKYSVVYVPYLLGWMNVAVCNNVLGVQILCASGFSNKYARSFKFSAFIFCVLIYSFHELDAGVAVCKSLLLSELILMLMLIYNIKITNFIKSANS